MDNQIINTCSCGRKYTLESWKKLPKLGDQKMDDGNEPSHYELRNCPCGSTRSIGFDSQGNYYKEN